MPNWCYTNISISRTAEEGGVQFLFDKLEEAVRSNSTTKNDYGKYWLGNIVEKFLNTDPTAGKYECRGNLCCFEVDPDGEHLTLDVETAWGPMNEMWVDIVENYAPGAEFLYTAEEPGMGIYVTNDPDYVGRYYLDCYDGPYDPNDIATEKDIKEIAEEVTGESFDERTVDDAIEALEDAEDCQISVHKWEYSPF